MYDKELLLSLSDEQRRQAYPQLRKKANRNIKKILEQDLQRSSVLAQLNRKRVFEKNYTTKRFLDVVEFITSESSTVRGIKAIQEKRLNTFKAQGWYNPDLPFNDLVAILDTIEFDALSRHYPSKTNVSLIFELFDDGYNLKEIKKILFGSSRLHKKPHKKR